MIIEDYVSFETAKLLKENGFNEPTIMIYNDKGVIDNVGSIHHYNSEPTFKCSGCISAPTQQMAMKWLREVHNIFIENCITRNRKGGIDHWCKVNTINDLTPMSNKHPFNVFIVDSEDSCSSYEKACEAAIKYCLENLI